jgi:hypothetical protein
MAKAIMGAALLAAVATAMQAEPGYMFITKAQADSVDAGDIIVDTATTDGDKAAAKLTEAGLAKVSGQPAPQAEKAPANVIVGLEGFEPAKGRAKRGNVMYPFDSLEVGGNFFVEGENAVKTLSSTASKLQRDTYGKEIVEYGQNGEPDKPVMETYKHKGEEKQRPKVEFTREFTVRAVKGGVTYGSWVAPADGAVVIRTK